MALESVPKFNAFTTKANGIVNVLQSNVSVFQPIPGKDSKIETFIAIWDTGATSTVVTPKVVANLGLIPSGKTNLLGVTGAKENADTFLVSIILPNKVRVDGVRVAEVPQLTGNADILIGMDIITIGDFSLTNVDKKTVFTFRFPSIKTIDYVEEVNKLNQLKFSKVGRNDPCPCGSKKKFKFCHGRDSSVINA
jgi:predicted aspartyl protease